MAKSLIVTTSFGYGRSDLSPFINSARLNSPNSDILIFCSDNDVQALKDLRSEYQQVILKPVQNPPRIIKGQTKFVRAAARRIQRASLATTQKIVDSKDGISIESDAIISKSTCQLHFLIRRFFWARQALLDPTLEEYKDVMLCDSRDVLIQKDPFNEIKGQLTSGEEINTVGDCQINRAWIQKAYGEKILSQLESRKIICAGVTIGSRENILKYLDIFCAESLALARRHSTCYLPNLDQAIHNKILRLSRELNPVLTKANGHIATVGWHKESDISIDVNRKQAVIDGSNPAIIHQYDRSKSLSEFVNTYYKLR